ncbi:unnamed protein product [Calypogeia fissa]
MAVIGNVSVSTIPRLYGWISKAQESKRPTIWNSSRLAFFSSGAYRKQILKRDCSGVGLEHMEFETYGRIWGRNWRGWTGRIPYLLSWSAGVGNGQVSAVEEEVGVMEGDVVEYPLAGGGGGVEQEDGKNGRRIGVGVIVDMIKDSDAVLCQIEPLCQEDPASKEWIHDESEPEITVPVGQVRVLQAWYSQRMVPDRISNPHGEHAENLWILE